MKALYYTPGTDPKWDEVCRQVTSVRTFITVLERAGA